MPDAAYPREGTPSICFLWQISAILLTIRTFSAILHGELFLLVNGGGFLNELTLQATFAGLLHDIGKLVWRAGLGKRTHAFAGAEYLKAHFADPPRNRIGQSGL